MRLAEGVLYYSVIHRKSTPQGLILERRVVDFIAGFAAPREVLISRSLPTFNLAGSTGWYLGVSGDELAAWLVEEVTGSLRHGSRIHFLIVAEVVWWCLDRIVQIYHETTLATYHIAEHSPFAWINFLGVTLINEVVLLERKGLETAFLVRELGGLLFLRFVLIGYVCVHVNSFQVIYLNILRSRLWDWLIRFLEHWKSQLNISLWSIFFWWNLTLLLLFFFYFCSDFVEFKFHLVAWLYHWLLF